MELMKALPVIPENKNIVITGGYGYLGTAITTSLAENGAKVYVFARDRIKFEKTYPRSRFSDSIIFVPCDIAQTESLTNGFSHVYHLTNGIDCIINNAFFLRGNDLDLISRDDFNFTIDGTLTSVYDSIRLSIPFLSTNACIINVSSMYGLVAPDFEAYKDFPEFINPPHYGASKAGVIQLTKYYASLLGRKGIRVNAVSPGPFPNPLVQIKKEFIRELEKRTLLNKIGSPDELAGIFVFLCSDAARYITGQNFCVDGGWTVR
jgi:gluconate 5-dehydrogenase